MIRFKVMLWFAAVLLPAAVLAQPWESTKHGSSSLAESLAASFSDRVYYKPVPKVYVNRRVDSYHPPSQYHTFHVPRYGYQQRGHRDVKERLAYIKELEHYQDKKHKQLLDDSIVSLEEATEVLRLAKLKHQQKKGKTTKPPVQIVTPPPTIQQQAIQQVSLVQSQLLNLQIQLQASQLQQQSSTNQLLAQSVGQPTLVTVGG